MSTINRRRFLSNTASGLAVGIGAVVGGGASPVLGQSPAVHTTAKSGSRKLIGEGDYQYEVSHDYFKLPGDFHWQTTHNVAVDKQNNVYIIHEGVEKLKDHPAIFVFDSEGVYIKSFEQEFQGGGHGLEVNHLKTVGGYLLPANVDLYEDMLMIPELQGRITLLGPNDEIVARLGDDAEYRKELLANKMAMRKKPDTWEDGRFIHPDDACFDKEGNILVAEWVQTGRITKLTRV